MQQFSYTIKDPDGVHARPAGAIIKKAKGFESKILIATHDKQVDLKSGIFALMGLGIRCGWEVVVTIEGVDEVDACVAMKEVFAENL